MSNVKNFGQILVRFFCKKLGYTNITILFNPSNKKKCQNGPTFQKTARKRQKKKLSKNIFKKFQNLEF
jgi:hypothetical protein